MVEHVGGIVVAIGWCCLCTYALWQLARALLWGVIYMPARLHGGDVTIDGDPLFFWWAIVLWAFIGPFITIGVAVFMWIQRNDKF